jgi:hypothetical protein
MRFRLRFSLKMPTFAGEFVFVIVKYNLCERQAPMVISAATEIIFGAKVYKKSIKLYSSAYIF